MKFEEWWASLEADINRIFSSTERGRKEGIILDGAKKLAQLAWVESRKAWVSRETVEVVSEFDAWWRNYLVACDKTDEGISVLREDVAQAAYLAGWSADIRREIFGASEGGVVRVKLFHDPYVFDARYAVGPLNIPALENPVGPFLDVRDRIRRLALRAADRSLNALIKHRLGLAKPIGGATGDSPDSEGHPLDSGDGG